MTATGLRAAVTATVTSAAAAALLVAPAAAPTAAYSGDIADFVQVFPAPSQFCDPLQAVFPCAWDPANDQYNLGPFDPYPHQTISGSRATYVTDTTVGLPGILVDVGITAYRDPQYAAAAWAQQNTDPPANGTLLARTDTSYTVLVVSPDGRARDVWTSVKAGDDAVVKGRCAQVDRDNVPLLQACSVALADWMQARWNAHPKPVDPEPAPDPTGPTSPPDTPAADLFTVPDRVLQRRLMTTTRAKSLLPATMTRANLRSRLTRSTGVPGVSDGNWTLNVTHTAKTGATRALRFTGRVLQYGTPAKALTAAARTCGMRPTASTAVKGATACAVNGPLLITTTSSARSFIGTAKTLNARQTLLLNGAAR